MARNFDPKQWYADGWMAAKNKRIYKVVREDREFGRVFCEGYSSLADDWPVGKTPPIRVWAHKQTWQFRPHHLAQDRAITEGEAMYFKLLGELPECK